MNRTIIENYFWDNNFDWWNEWIKINCFGGLPIFHTYIYDELDNSDWDGSLWANLCDHLDNENYFNNHVENL